MDQYNRRSTAPDGLQWRCRACCRKWYEKNRLRHGQVTRVRTSEVRTALALRISRYLFEHPCVDCGETDVRCLEFDHRDRTTKIAAVSALIARQFSWDKIMAEIDKCDVRCANCHRKRTAVQFNTRKHRFFLETAPPPPIEIDGGGEEGDGCAG